MRITDLGTVQPIVLVGTGFELGITYARLVLIVHRHFPFFAFLSSFFLSFLLFIFLLFIFLFLFFLFSILVLVKERANLTLKRVIFDVSLLT